MLIYEFGMDIQYMSCVEDYINHYTELQIPIRKQSESFL